MAVIRKRGKSYYIDFRFQGKRKRACIGVDRAVALDTLDDINFLLSSHKRCDINNEVKRIIKDNEN